MTGLLLDPLTGKATEERARVPNRGDEQPWKDELERALALKRVEAMLRGSDDYRATTTTRAYKCYPAAAAGVSLTASATAWANPASWTQIVPVSTITSTFYIAALTWMWWTPLAATDTTYELELEIGTGAASSETSIIIISQLDPQRHRRRIRPLKLCGAARAERGGSEHPRRRPDPDIERGRERRDRR